MARYTGAVCKMCRREGKKLFLKGERCYTQKCAFERRSYAPGQHGQGRKKTSEYGLQLRAKQQARRYYGINESQFHKYFLMAERKQGMTGENLLRICESRLDNVVYLLGWASSRAEGRQLVTHNHYLVNGKKVNIPPYRVKVGDVIALAEKDKTSEKFKSTVEATNGRVVPMWLNANKDNFSASVVRMPSAEDIDYEVAAHLIVELYSK